MLVAFGGAGPAHAVRIAEEVGVKRVLVPLAPGTASAMGLLSTDIRLESTTTIINRTDLVDPAQIGAAFKSMEEKGARELAQAASAHSGTAFERWVEMRYYGQSFELAVPAPEGEVGAEWLAALVEQFHAAHQQSYGFRVDGEPVEIVNLRSTAVGKIRNPEMRRLGDIGGSADGAIKRRRPVYFNNEQGFAETPVYDRARLPGETGFSGPAIIEEKDCTTVVPPGWEVSVDEFGDLLVSRG
jgi:N-methylhydantoinase A